MYQTILFRILLHVRTSDHKKQYHFWTHNIVKGINLYFTLLTRPISWHVFWQWGRSQDDICSRTLTKNRCKLFYAANINTKWELNICVLETERCVFPFNSFESRHLTQNFKDSTDLECILTHILPIFYQSHDGGLIKDYLAWMGMLHQHTTWAGLLTESHSLN